MQEGMIHGDEKYPEKAVEHNDLKGMLLDEAGNTYRQTSLSYEFSRATSPNIFLNIQFKALTQNNFNNLDREGQPRKKMCI